MAIIHKLHTTTSLTGLNFIMSDPTPDRYGDICECKPDSWSLDNFRKNNVALFGHNSSFPIGTWENVRVENGALRGRLELAPEGASDRIDEVRALVKAGVLKATSVGFRPIESRPRSNSSPGEIYTKLELIECSLVAVPANPNALMVAKKLGISRKTMAIAFNNNGTDVTITEHSDYQRRQAVHAKAKAILERLNREMPSMMADIAAMRLRERQRQVMLAEERAFLEEYRRAWPSYASWRGEDL